MNESIYLPVWAAAAALASVPLMHWWLLRRGLAVSGRFTALVDRLRHGAPETDATAGAAPEELAAALRAMTAETFGADAIDADAPPIDADHPVTPPPPADPSTTHVLFLIGLVIGGALGALSGVGFAATSTLRGELFSQFFGGSPILSTAVLFGGGLLVGAGTRMAGGCTSGHGLCGVSQMQSGSLVTTAAFFGTGVLTSFLLAAFL